MQERRILHIDQNCFYASVEMRMRPELRSVPMAVVGDAERRHGIVLAKNPLAAVCGVKTAQTIWQAQQLCPDLVTVPARMHLYRACSDHAFELFCRYTDRVEPFGLDECWLDVTGVDKCNDPTRLANEIKDRIKREIGLTCSVGISYNKVFAKLGSDYKKPDATTVFEKEDLSTRIWPLPIGTLLYAGKATQAQMKRINVCTIGDFARLPLAYICDVLGKHGHRLWLYANGKDLTPVRYSWDVRPPVSIGNSTTTARDIIKEEEIRSVFTALADQVATRLREKKLSCGTLQIYIRDYDLEQIERQIKLSCFTRRQQVLANTACHLFFLHHALKKPVRSLGLRVTDLLSDDQYRQQTIDELLSPEDKSIKLDDAIDCLRLSYGTKIIFRGVQLIGGNQLLLNGQLPSDDGPFLF